MKTKTIWDAEIAPRIKHAKSIGASMIHQTSDHGRLDLNALRDYAHAQGHRAGFYGRDLTIMTSQSLNPLEPLPGLE